MGREPATLVTHVQRSNSSLPDIRSAVVAVTASNSSSATWMIVLPRARRVGSRADRASARGTPHPRLEGVDHPANLCSRAASWPRSGSTTKKTACRSSGRTRGGSAMVTSVPLERTNFAERSRTSPPITSNTTSTSPTCSSPSRCKSTKVWAPEPSTFSRWAVRPLPTTRAPASRASCTASEPTAPAAP